MVTERLGRRRRVVQYHWVGGTPTYYASDQLKRLHELLFEHLDLDPEAEVAIEVDSRVAQTH
jgi:oxygen-independent coproporphyrinogen-3 oxidase